MLKSLLTLQNHMSLPLVFHANCIALFFLISVQCMVLFLFRYLHLPRLCVCVCVCVLIFVFYLSTIDQMTYIFATIDKFILIPRLIHIFYKSFSIKCTLLTCLINTCLHPLHYVYVGNQSLIMYTYYKHKEI